jgi:hypothetical protein
MWSLLYVLILYDERDDVRRAEVISSETEAGAVEQAHRTAVAAPGFNGYELWHGGQKIAAHFFRPRQRRPLMPPDGQQGSTHLPLNPAAAQFG